MTFTSVREIEHGRVIVEGTLDDVDGTRFTALCELRDDRIVGVRAYMSERDLLEQLGLLTDADEDR